MTDAIGRGDYVLGADYSGVEKSVDAAEDTIKRSAVETEKAYADAGKKAGDKFGAALRIGLKVATGVAAAGFALATKGAVELENATASFRAETGATAEEAKKAGNAILGMSAKNIAPLEEIGRALTKVHTDLGLTGEEAEKVTERFLRFARATKQDAAAAVVAFDDILDAWGLTAKDATKIMDYLVASHQKYGGSIEENQAALSRMAPQLRALNMQWQDGANLLNLFAESGLDAGGAQRALNSAISNLPKGESLEQFLVRLSKITDDGKRAQEAMKVFGARAGAGLANAIRPGVSSLDAFGFKASEVEGKVDAAADALDSTFSARLQLMIKAVSAQVTGFASALGPAVTAAASLATGAAALGLNVKGAIPAIKNLIVSLGTLKFAVAATGIGALILVLAALGMAASDTRPEIDKLREALNTKNLFGEGLPEGLKNDIVRRISEIEVAQSVQLQNTQAWAAKLGDTYRKSGIPEALGTVMDAMQAEVDAGRAEFKVSADGLTEIVPKSLEAAKNTAVAIARATPGEIAAALREKRATWQNAVAQLGTDLENTMTRSAEIAKLKAELIGKNITAGLKSKDPVVKAQAEATTKIILDRLVELQGQAPTYGSKTGNAYADGIIAGLKERIAETKRAVGKYRGIFEASSPPGPESPLHDIDKWGRRTIQAYADAIASGRSMVTAAAQHALGGVPGMMAGGLAANLMTSSSQEQRFVGRLDIGLTAEAAAALRKAGYDERGVAGVLAAGVDLSGLLAEVRQRVSLRPG